MKKKKIIIWEPCDVDFIFRSYQIFEEKLLDILKIIPFSKSNKKTWSPEIVNLFLDISSLIDSVSRNIISEGKGINKIVKIKNNKGAIISKKVSDLNINDFENNLFFNLHLNNDKTVIYNYPVKIIKPFEKYREKNGWWNIYNLLKHNRVKNYNKANIEKVINSLAAFFLLLVRYKEVEFSKALFRFEWMETGIVPELIHHDRIKEGTSNFWYDTKLFGTHDISKKIPDNISTINPVLTSQKFQKFFGRFNSQIK